MSLAATDHDVLGHTVEIVAAFVGNNVTGPGDIPNLITSIYGALSTLGTILEPKVPPQESAVPIRASVKPEFVTCLECGSKHKMLKRHLMAAHSLSPEQYRKKWGLKADHPITAPNYSAKRTELAKDIGLGRKVGGK